MRILTVDCNQLARRKVAGILPGEKQCEFCGEASNGGDAHQMSREMPPGLVLLDMNLPGASASDRARIPREEIQEIKTRIMSYHDPSQIQPQRKVPGVGVEPLARLQSCKLFITRSDKSDKSARNAEVRYTAGTRSYASGLRF
jgi:CheY-like chemotaxis protein